jgi:hypothetical protein
MNPDPEELRRTTVLSERIPTAKARFNAGAFFAHKDRLARLCATVALVSMGIAGLALALAIPNLGHKPLFVILDAADTPMRGHDAEFQDANKLHVQQAMLATTALLLRNPKDLDQPEVIQTLFSQPAQAQATALKTAESAEFVARQIRQKPEVARIEAIATRQDEVQIEVTGQLVRTGLIKDAAFTEALRFTLRLVLKPNPDLLRNQRQPTLVAQFTLRYAPART